MVIMAKCGLKKQSLCLIARGGETRYNKKQCTALFFCFTAKQAVCAPRCGHVAEQAPAPRACRQERYRQMERYGPVANRQCSELCPYVARVKVFAWQNGLAWDAALEELERRAARLCPGGALARSAPPAVCEQQGALPEECRIWRLLLCVSGTCGMTVYEYMKSAHAAALFDMPQAGEEPRQQRVPRCRHPWAARRRRNKKAVRRRAAGRLPRLRRQRLLHRRRKRTGRNSFSAGCTAQARHGCTARRAKCAPAGRMPAKGCGRQGWKDAQGSLRLHSASLRQLLRCLPPWGFRIGWVTGRLCGKTVHMKTAMLRPFLKRGHMKAAMQRHWKKTEAMRRVMTGDMPRAGPKAMKQAGPKAYEEGLKDGMAEPGQPPAASGSGAAAEQQAVWVSRYLGRRYHSTPDCSRVIDPVQITLEEAEREGYSRCSRCCGEE